MRPGRGERELTEVSPALFAPAAASAKISFYTDHDHTTAIDSSTITIPADMASTEYWDRIHGLNFNFRTLMVGIDTIVLTGAEPLTITNIGIWHRALVGGV